MGQRHLDRGTLRRRLHARSRQQRGMKKATEAAQALAAQASFLLCAVLAQCGGTKTVTQGTLDQCMQETARMGFKMAPGAIAGEYEVVLMYRDEPEAVEPNVAPIAPIAPINPDVAPIVITG